MDALKIHWSIWKLSRRIKHSNIERGGIGISNKAFSSVLARGFVRNLRNMLRGLAFFVVGSLLSWGPGWWGRKEGIERGLGASRRGRVYWISEKRVGFQRQGWYERLACAKRVSDPEPGSMIRPRLFRPLQNAQPLFCPIQRLTRSFDGSKLSSVLSRSAGNKKYGTTNIYLYYLANIRYWKMNVFFLVYVALGYIAIAVQVLGSCRGFEYLWRG